MRIRTSPFSLLRHPLFKPSARPFLLRRGFTTPSTPSSRLNKLNTRLPRFLQKYTTPLLNAPITHITSFLILHEITAIVPLLGLAGIFHYTEWLPPFFAEGKWIKEGVERFGKYFRRKGWLGKIEEGEIEGVKADLDKDGGRIGSRPRRDVWWGRGEGGVRVVVEFATAYAVTKALLPLRLIFSVWATPWFARVAIVPVTKRFKGLFRGRKAKSAIPTAGVPQSAAGTGAVAGNALPKKGPELTGQSGNMKSS